MREYTPTELVRLSDACIHLLVKEKLRGAKLVKKVRDTARRICQLTSPRELDGFIRKAVRLAETELTIRRPADPIAFELTSEFEGTEVESKTGIVRDQNRGQGSGSRASRARSRSRTRVGHRRSK